jgi:ribose 5-phosphate isomerase B
MCIVANKVKGARAVNAYDKTTAELSRRHNDANILCLGARLLDMNKIKSIIKTWLNTPFEGGRHQRRIDKISRLESAK